MNQIAESLGLLHHGLSGISALDGPQILIHDGQHYYLSRARMGPETDIVEPVLAGNFVQKICPGMYRESSEPILK